MIVYYSKKNNFHNCNTVKLIKHEHIIHLVIYLLCCLLNILHRVQLHKYNKCNHVHLVWLC